MLSNQECEHVPSMGCVRSQGQAFGVFGDGWNDLIDYDLVPGGSGHSRIETS
jgi:hypothetical protein